MKQLISTAAVTLTLSFAPPGIANAAEIHVWTARAIATVLAEIGPQFERTTGHHLNVYSGLPVDFDKRVKAGDFRRELGNSDVHFLVKKDGVVFGKLEVSRGALVWYPKNARRGHKVGWQRLHDIAQERRKSDWRKPR